MKIRRYLGNNAQEAILKVKMDLGNEALILNTRKVRRKGLLGFFSKPMVEVLAAVDEYYNTKKSNDVQEQKTRPKEKEDEVVNNSGILREKEEKIEVLENKVNSVETLLQKILEQMQAPEQKKEEVNQVVENKQEFPRILDLFFKNLVKNEVEDDIAKQIISAVEKKVGSNASVNDAASVLYNIISGILGKAETIKLREDGKPTVAILVGPTGVGKTTTLAKIAANYLLNYKKKVALVTADTYRIAAVEQLKTYAEILGIPLSIVYSPNDMKEALSLHSDKDIILIDTAGRSHKNKAQFEELKALISASGADEIFLVLSVTTSIRNNREIISNYNFLKDYKLIFTKMDETPVTGIILNTRFLTKKSLSYITIGQSVPDDIEVANTDKITKNLLGSIS